MRLLVTRPREDGEETVRRLSDLGHHTLLAPMLDIAWRKDALLPAGEFNSIAVTSRNGLRFLAEHRDGARFRDVPLLIVGERSAQLARELNFHGRVMVSESAEGLIKAIVSLPSATRLLYIRGADISADIASHLGASGIDVDEVIAYEAIPCATLPLVAGDALRRGQVDGVLFYSVRTVHAFVAAISAGDLQGAMRKLTAYCLSAKVAAALPAALFEVIAFARSPNEEDLFALLPNG